VQRSAGNEPLALARLASTVEIEESTAALARTSDRSLVYNGQDWELRTVDKAIHWVGAGCGCIGRGWERQTMVIPIKCWQRFSTSRLVREIICTLNPRERNRGRVGRTRAVHQTGLIFI